MSKFIVSADVRFHRGRPTIFINDQPLALPTYSPRGWDDRYFHNAVRRFAKHRMGAYFLCVPRLKDGGFFDRPFWLGDTISATPLGPMTLEMDEQADFILRHDPDAFFLVRGGPDEPPSWRELHADQLVIDEDGKTWPCPSLASPLYCNALAAFSEAMVNYCESRTWASRLIGYWNGLRSEGTHEPMMRHMLYDHSPLMLTAWRDFLERRYRSVEALRSAWGDDSADFKSIQVPRDPLLGPTPEVSQLPYFQTGTQNAPMRDYLLLLKELFHRQFHTIAAATRAACDRFGRRRVLLYDALKQQMLGWTNNGFFDTSWSWPVAHAELTAGSGHLDVAELFGTPGLDGIVTPYDYHHRGIGGVCEQEAPIDSLVLRGKYYFSEIDQRTWHGRDHYHPAANPKEFEAISWRNVASGLTRGFNPYYMDLHEDWYQCDSIHSVIEKQVRVLEQSTNWPLETVPGIAMVLDDSAILDTNGNGAIFNEQIMWEWRTGLAHCGVPFRTYLLQDLALANLPAHRVWYFPNLYRVDDQRLALLQRVQRDGNVIVYGPGSGVSDGRSISAENASRMTGFTFDHLGVNDQRRVQITDFAHPITANLDADFMYGSPTPFGPCLFPRDGRRLGRAIAKQGRLWGGLSLKTLDTHHALFTASSPLPANLWRNIARFAGAHVYNDQNDVTLANSSIVAVHAIKPGLRTICLPKTAKVTDLVVGRPVGDKLDRIEVSIDAPQTQIFLLE